jgi:hypothetical protein
LYGNDITAVSYEEFKDGINVIFWNIFFIKQIFI